MSNIVLAIERSQNRKTGLVSATYAPIHSCPKTCPFMDKGCYGQLDFCGIHLSKINKAAEEQKKTEPKVIARIEAQRIRKLSGKRPLRLHVVGDCRTREATQTVSRACKAYKNKHKQPVWTYTHAWRRVPRRDWGDTSVLASCETVDECVYAMERGYAAQICTPEYITKRTKVGDFTIIPCKNNTEGIQCVECRICMHDRRLHQRREVLNIGAHGTKAKQVQEIIKVKRNGY